MDTIKMIITFPKELHRKLKIKSAQEGVTMNAKVIKALESDFKKSKNDDNLIYDDYQDAISPKGRSLKK